MNYIDQTVDNGVEEYMTLVRRADEVLAQCEKETEEGKDTSETVDDVQAIRKQLVDKVKESGISRDIIEDSKRMLSIF